MVLPVFAKAEEVNPKSIKNVFVLRAGGGSTGGGGGSSSGGSGTHGHNYSRYDSPISNYISYIMFMIFAFFGSIVFYFKILRSSMNSWRYLKLLGKKEISWKYKNIEKQAIETFYSVEEAWTNMDMSPSKEYMSQDLYDSFMIKLNFMEVNKRRNILKKIKLWDIKPVSIYDDSNDSEDYIWFYIKGKMIDYIINTETNDIIEGNKYSKSFVEFWKFTRDNNRWVLTKIKQKDDANTINFQ